MTETSSEHVVSTTYGPVRGHPRASGIAFLGIPFAGPPTGPHRFGEPVPPEPWTEVRDALAYGPTPARITVEDHMLPESIVPGEDTLSVNVFAPVGATAGAGLPVLFWLHGGGFMVGSPANTWYEGDAFVRAGVVVVTASYRLGLDGFGWIDGAPQNRGVLDWIAALEWVQANIGEFGGDPTRVTIAGQSAGGGAVLTLLGLPQAQHLFRAAVSASGAAPDIAETTARALATDLAGSAGVTPDRSGFGSLSEQQLADVQSGSGAAPGPSWRGRFAMVRTLLTGRLPFGPTIDGDVVTRSTFDSYAAGVGADKPLFVYATEQETDLDVASQLKVVNIVPPLMVLRLLGVGAGVARTYIAQHPDMRGARLAGHLSTDRLFRTTVLRAALARTGAPTWLGRFAWKSPTHGSALHCVDLPFLFDSLGDANARRLVGVDPPVELVREIHGSVLALVRGEEMHWPRWTPEAGSTRVFATRCTTEDDGYRDVRVLL